MLAVESVVRLVHPAFVFQGRAPEVDEQADAVVFGEVFDFNGVFGHM